MNPKTKNFFLALFILIGAILFSLSFWPDEKLHLIFCDVGQGDAILAEYKDLQVLIDGGPSGSAVLNCLSAHLPPWDRELELMVLTHPDSDHITGLIDVLERYQVDQVVVNAVVKDSGVFWRFHQAVLAENTQIYSPQADDEMKLGPIKLAVLWPQEKIGDSRLWETDNQDFLVQNVLGTAVVDEKANETSIVLKLSYDNFDALLTGDISFDTEKKINFPQVEVLKIPHHGSAYSTSEELLQEASPVLAVISVGKNSFGHPTQEVLSKLSRAGIELRRTDENGEVELTTNGQSWQVD